MRYGSRVLACRCNGFGVVLCAFNVKVSALFRVLGRVAEQVADNLDEACIIPVLQHTSFD
jgi:hypothetical protein